jgi:hypothetical protein
MSSPVEHVVRLSNGNTVILTEEDEELTLSAMGEDYSLPICTINDSGVQVYPVHHSCYEDLVEGLGGNA